MLFWQGQYRGDCFSENKLYGVCVCFLYICVGTDLVVFVVVVVCLFVFVLLLLIICGLMTCALGKQIGDRLKIVFSPDVILCC